MGFERGCRATQRKSPTIARGYLGKLLLKSNVIRGGMGGDEIAEASPEQKHRAFEGSTTSSFIN